MKTSVNFDRVSDIYDITRAMPGPMAEAVIGGIIEQGRLTPGCRVLEMGVGTGRIAAPLVEAMPLEYMGIDISSKMLARLKRKAPGKVQPVRADVTNLPFRDESFDLILAVHVFHLVTGWKEAIEDAKNALKSDGVFLVAGENGLRKAMMENFTTVTVAPPQFAARAKEIVEKLGIGERWRGMNCIDEAVETFRDLGATTTVPPIIEHSFEMPLNIIVGVIQGRVFTDLWEVSQELLDSCVEDLKDIILDHFGSLEARIPLTRRFEMVCASF